MKINYIKEGYFNNPGQMKAKAEKNKAVSKAQALAATANDIVTRELRELLQDFVKRDFQKEHHNGEEDNILSYFVFGNSASSLFYINYPGRPELKECVTRYEPKIISFENNLAVIEIYVFLTFPEWRHHLEKRREEDKTRNPIIFKNNDSYDLQLMAHSFREEYLNRITSSIKKEFYTGLQEYCRQSRWSFPSDSPSHQLRIDIYYDAIKVDLNKIHLFFDVEGDIVFNTTTFIGITHDSLVDCRDRALREFKTVFDLISFENSGNIILRDSLNRGPDIVLNPRDKELLAEGYFNNPEQMKKKADMSKNISKAEMLAKTSQQTIENEIEHIIDSFLVITKEDFQYNKSSADIIPTKVAGEEMSPMFYIEYDKPSNDVYFFLREKSATSLKSKITVSPYETIDVELYVRIELRDWIRHIKERQANENNPTWRTETSKPGWKDYRYDALTNIGDAFTNVTFDNYMFVFRKNLINFIRERPEFRNSAAGQMLLSDEISIDLVKIHMFSEIEGDIVFASAFYGCPSEETINAEEEIAKKQRFDFFKHRLENLLRGLSFENSGRIIIRDKYRRGSDIIIKDNKVVDED